MKGHNHMATSSKTPGKRKSMRETLTDADNPSLIKAGDEIRLRVFDDFFIEESLPKWQNAHARFDALQKRLSEWLRYRRSLADGFDDTVIKNAISKLSDPEEQKKLDDERKQLKLMSDQLRDDRWSIQSKHETSVNESILKTARIVISHKDTVVDKLKKKFFPKRYAEQFVPVEVAFADLKSHIVNTSTETLRDAYAKLITMEKRLRESGQIVKADRLKLYFDDLTIQTALVDAGFNTFLNEQDLIDFVKKSERGTRIDFLRYYEGTIPDDVLEKKLRADAAMVFDNYVVAFYDDSIKNRVAAAATIKKVAKAKSKKAAQAAVDKRRDPILFGIVKGVRRLFYIADWVTEDDDLTLQVVEDALGIQRHRLDNVLDSGQGQLIDGDNDAELVVGPATTYAEYRQARNTLEDDYMSIYNEPITNSVPS